MNDVCFSQDIATRAEVRHGVVMAWAAEYRARAAQGVMMINRGGERSCMLSLPATIGLLSLALPARRRAGQHWAALMNLACDTLQEVEAQQEPVTDPAVAMLSAALELAGEGGA
jgi:hypothetical protein